MKRFLCVGLAVLCLAPALASARNLLRDPDFDAGVDSWRAINSSVEIVWDPALDVDGNPNSGSGRVTNLFDGRPNVINGARGECLALSWRETFELSAWVRIPGGQSAEGSARFELQWFESADCTSQILEIWTLEASEPVEEWLFLERIDAVPLGAQSASPLLSVLRMGDSDRVAQFDAVYAPEPPAKASVAAGFAALAVLAGVRSMRGRAGSGRTGR